MQDCCIPQCVSNGDTAVLPQVFEMIFKTHAFMSDFIISTGSVDDLAPLGARTSAGTVIFKLNICTGPAHRGLKNWNFTFFPLCPWQFVTCHTSVGIPIVKIRLYSDNLIFKWECPYDLDIEMGPRKVPPETRKLPHFCWHCLYKSCLFYPSKRDRLACKTILRGGLWREVPLCYCSWWLWYQC